MHTQRSRSQTALRGSTRARMHTRARDAYCAVRFAGQLATHPLARLVREAIRIHACMLVLACLRARSLARRTVARLCARGDGGAAASPTVISASANHSRATPTAREQDEHGEPAEFLWSLMSSYLSSEPNDIAQVGALAAPRSSLHRGHRHCAHCCATAAPLLPQYIVNHLEYTLARSRMNFDFFGTFQATSFRCGVLVCCVVVLLADCLRSVCGQAQCARSHD